MNAGQIFHTRVTPNSRLARRFRLAFDLRQLQRTVSERCRKHGGVHP
jgi:hypothetical protein